MSGIYPPAASVPGQTEDRVFSQREKEALDLWTTLIRGGGATVKTTDYVEAVRFSKVSLGPPVTMQVLTEIFEADLRTERLELWLVIHPRPDPYSPIIVCGSATRSDQASAGVHERDCRCRLRKRTLARRHDPVPNGAAYGVRRGSRVGSMDQGALHDFARFPASRLTIQDSGNIRGCRQGRWWAQNVPLGRCRDGPAYRGRGEGGRDLLQNAKDGLMPAAGDRGRCRPIGAKAQHQDAPAGLHIRAAQGLTGRSLISTNTASIEQVSMRREYIQNRLLSIGIDMVQWGLFTQRAVNSRRHSPDRYRSHNCI